MTGPSTEWIRNARKHAWTDGYQAGWTDATHTGIPNNAPNPYELAEEETA